MATLPAPLCDALARLAKVPELLVASDYDGVLAPIVANPAEAYPLPEAVAELRALARLPRTAVALVSGRARRDLAALSGLPPEVHLVGGHGAEFDDGFAERLDPAASALLDRLLADLEPLVARYPGVRLEVKPASIAVHTRTAGRADAAAAADAVRTGPGSRPGVRVIEGKEVVELSVLDTTKGTALDVLRHRLGADAVLFLGDDVTDEAGFAHLTDADVGVKVGDGPTAAAYRVPDPPAAAALLHVLAEARLRR